MQQAAIYAGGRSPVQTSSSWPAYAGRDLRTGLPIGPAPRRPPSFPGDMPGRDSMAKARWTLAD